MATRQKNKAPAATKAPGENKFKSPVENKAGLSPDIAGQFVTKSELGDFQKQIIDALEALSERISAPVVITQPIGSTTATQIVPSKVKPAEADMFTNGILPMQYQKVFEKYFDPEDGFEARLNFPEVDERGLETGGITFTIIVPMKFSNTVDAYRKLYKQDLRTRALQPHNISKGIDEWCAAVSKNLRYNKNLKTK